MSGRFALPALARDTALALGGASAAWVETLPYLVAGLARDWGVSVGAVLHGGSAALVVEALTEASEPVVLKVAMPGPEDFDAEVRALTLADGRGCPALLPCDLSRRAMLQPRLGRRLGEMGHTTDRQMEIVCATLRLAWVRVPDPSGFTTGAGKAAWLANAITEMWDAQGRPCSPQVIERAQDFAGRRAASFDPATSVLVHGDAHADNTLEASGSPSGFQFVDPDGLFVEPAYDLAIPMREWSEDLLAGDPLALGQARCARLAALSGLEVPPSGSGDSWNACRRVCIA